MLSGINFLVAVLVIKNQRKTEFFRKNFLLEHLCASYMLKREKIISFAGFWKLFSQCMIQFLNENYIVHFSLHILKTNQIHFSELGLLNIFDIVKKLPFIFIFIPSTLSIIMKREIIEENRFSKICWFYVKFLFIYPITGGIVKKMRFSEQIRFTFLYLHLYMCMKCMDIYLTIWMNSYLLESKSKIFIEYFMVFTISRFLGACIKLLRKFCYSF